MLDKKHKLDGNFMQQVIFQYNTVSHVNIAIFILFVSEKFPTNYF